jgi:heptosyltransferase-2
MQKILVIQTAFIGDVVLATALVEKLHVHYPAAQIDFMLRQGNEGLLQLHPYLGKVWIWAKKKNKYRNLLHLIIAIRKEGYDVVINVQRFAASGLLTVFSGASYTVGFNKNPWSWLFTKRVKHVISTPNRPLHEIDRNQQLIADLTDKEPAKPRLHPQPAHFNKIKNLQSEPYFVVAPASVWYTKQFPVEKWIAFLKTAPAQLKVYLIGGPGDHAMAERILSGSQHPKVENLCGKLGFLESAALQGAAIMNYTNDSAPMHFASSMNAPVTAIYCSTLPSFGFGPLSDRSFIVETRETLECKPCGLHGRAQCPKGHFKCALGISPEQLTATLEQ